MCLYPCTKVVCRSTWQPRNNSMIRRVHFHTSIMSKGNGEMYHIDDCIERKKLETSKRAHVAARDVVRAIFTNYDVSQSATCPRYPLPQSISISSLQRPGTNTTYHRSLVLHEVPFLLRDHSADFVDAPHSSTSY